MLLLLKMHAFKAIELAQQTIDKLEAIILEAIEAKEVRLTLLANNAALITKKNVADIDSDRAVPLVKIMSRCLEESEANHTFEYLWNFVELGYRARNEELLTSAVNAMANLQLLPYQITKLFDIIRFFPYMCLSSFISKVVPQIQAFARALDPFLAELIYIIHSLQKDIP